MSRGQEAVMANAEEMFGGGSSGAMSPTPMQVVFPPHTTNPYSSGSGGDDVHLAPPGFNMNEVLPGSDDPSVKKRGMPSACAGGGGENAPSFKKPRGRPRGSINKIKKSDAIENQHFQPQQHVSEGPGLTPHVISVKAGEDVSSKIMSFVQNGPRAVCILSANGVISCVSLRQADTLGGTTTYEGRFEIISLYGSFFLAEVAGLRTRTGSLGVVLSGPDGGLLAGSVAGLLTAASPVQVIVGSFIADSLKETKGPPTHMASAHHPFSPRMMPMPMSMQPAVFFAAGVSSNPTTNGGSVDESSGGEGGEGINTPGGTASNHNNSNPQSIFVPW